uniref:Secreted protein n=1 Tax=Panagrellus redivivus TaxID=6233 RepID=A0A7E4ZWY3_PANRE
MRDIICLCVLAVLAYSASAVPVNKAKQENETAPTPVPTVAVNTTTSDNATESSSSTQDPIADYSAFTGNFYDYFSGATGIIEYFYDTTGSSVLPVYDDYSLPTGFFDYVSGFSFGTTPSGSTTVGGDNDTDSDSSSSGSGEVVHSLRQGKPVALVEASASDPWWAADSNSSADELIDHSKDANFSGFINASDIPTAAGRLRPAVMPFIDPVTTDLANQTINDLSSNDTGRSSGIMRPAVLPFVKTDIANETDDSASNDTELSSGGIMRPAVMPFIKPGKADLTNSSSEDLSLSNDSITSSFLRPAVMPFKLPDNDSLSGPAILPYIHNDTLDNDSLIRLSENQSAELVDPMFSVPIAILTNSTGNASAIIPTGLPNQIKKKKLDTLNTVLPGKLKNLKKNKTKEIEKSEESGEKPKTSSSEESKESLNGTLADSGSAATEAPQKLIKVKGKIDLGDDGVTTGQVTGSTDKPGGKSVLENAVNPVVQSVISNWHNRNSELLGQIQRT